MRVTIIATLALALAACGSANTPSSEQALNRAAPAAARSRIASLPEARLNVAFYRAIYDAGHHCAEVVGSVPAAPYHGMPVWTVTCRGGGHWTIVIAADDTVQILNADEARLVRDQPGNSH